MQAELTAVAHELFTGTEPGFDYVTLWATCAWGGGFYRLDAEPSDARVVSFEPRTNLFKLGVDQPVVLELTVTGDGTFEAVVTRDIIQVASMLPPTYTVVLEPRDRPAMPEVSSLADVEAALGVTLPVELHELYTGNATIDDDIPLFSPDVILQTWETHIALRDEDPQEWEQPVLYAGPPDAVRTVNFHERWVPFGANDWGDTLCVDLAPGPRGRVGQVIQMAGEGPLTYLADSVAGLMLPDSYPGTEGLEEHFDAADRSPAALPSTLQKVTVREPGDFDFGQLDRLTSVRELTVVRGGSVRLAALAHLPLERLEVSGYEIELPVCETLTALVVDGAFVDLPPLPNLRVLDVSKAHVDVESLPQVDYLVLTAEQWRRCSVIPAAAGLVGETSLARALDWASGLGLELPRQVFSGRISG